MLNYLERLFRPGIESDINISDIVDLECVYTKTRGVYRVLGLNLKSNGSNGFWVHVKLESFPNNNTYKSGSLMDYKLIKVLDKHEVEVLNDG